MKKIILFILCAMLALGGCAYTRDGDKDYMPRHSEALPTVNTAEAGSVEWVAAKLIAKGQMVREVYALKTIADMEQACTVRTNGMDVQIYKFPEDSALLAEIRESGAYPIKDDEGNVLATRRAAVNGVFVLMIPSDLSGNAEDMSALNDKLVDRFMNLKL